MERRYLPLAFSLILLLVAIGLNVVNRRALTSNDSLLEKLESDIATAIREVNREATDIMRNAESPQLFTTLDGTIDGVFFLFKDEKLKYWSDHHVLPDYYTMSSQRSRSILRVNESLYLLMNYSFEPGYELFGLVELYRKLPVSNDYLPSGFNTEIFPVRDGLQLNDPGTGGLPVYYLESHLFDIDFGQAVKVRSEWLGFFIVILFFASIVLLSVYVWTILREKVFQGDFEPALVQWTAYLVGLRYFLLLFDFPDRVVETGLFESLFFASSRINPSLGDMMINILLINAVVLFLYRYQHRSSFLRYLLGLGRAKRWIAALFLLSCIYVLLWYPHVLIQTIYRNSQISLDISQSLSFGYPRVVSYLIFFLSGINVFFGFHVFFRVLYQISFRKKGMFIILLASGTVFLIILQWVTGGHLVIVALIGGALMMVLYQSRIFRQFHRLRYNSFLYLFTMVSVISFLGAYGIYEFEEERDRIGKERFADYFLIKNDNLTEYYLNEANGRIQEDLFISTRLSSPFLSKEVIEDKIRQVHLGSQFDKYDINIGIYGEKEQLVAGDSTEALDLLLNGKSLDQFETEYDNIYFINRVEGEIGKRYIDKIEIRRRDATVGYVVLDLKLKKVIPNDVYFELLLDNRFAQPWLGKDYNYAIFSQKRVLYNSGNYNYKGSFPVTMLEEGSNLYSTGVEVNGYTHVGLRDLDGRIIVVSSPAYSLLFMASNFSFLLVIQIGLLLLAGFFFATVLLYQRVSINFSTRIQLYFNLAFFIPMVIVSFVTLSSTNRMFREEVTYEFSVKAENVTENLTTVLDRYINGQINRDGLLDKLLEVGRYTDTDINLYNRFGQLIATSRPIIFDNALLTRNLNAGAVSRVIENNGNSWLADERVGKLDYKTVYYSVRSFRTGDLIGVLGVPFFESEVQLERQQIEVLSSILTIFTFVFVAFLLLSYFVSKGLTYPLRIITKKLGKTSLNQKNEPLEWSSEDEIGLMVTEYNRMLSNLEESKEALARSQKEVAWREIAQQVAHEIKNPLTPMKLTLQHIERKLKEEDTEQLKKPISNLLGHIDTLSDIASSFSSFARMPIPESKPFEVISVLKSAIDLHKNLEMTEIISLFGDEECLVIGDRQLMGRIFSNILLNAAQARREGQRATIEVDVDIQLRNVIFSFSDNGTGIDPSVATRIFIPNFTTKEKGSGIGLSIAKHGIEHAGGKIWFESEKDKGTVFYIELLRAMK